MFKCPYDQACALAVIALASLIVLACVALAFDSETACGGGDLIGELLARNP